MQVKNLLSTDYYSLFTVHCSLNTPHNRDHPGRTQELVNHFRARFSTALRLCYFLLDQKVTKKSRTASGTFLCLCNDFSESRFL